MKRIIGVLSMIVGILIAGYSGIVALGFVGISMIGVIGSHGREGVRDVLVYGGAGIILVVSGVALFTWVSGCGAREQQSI